MFPGRAAPRRSAIRPLLPQIGGVAPAKTHIPVIPGPSCGKPAFRGLVRRPIGRQPGAPRPAAGPGHAPYASDASRPPASPRPKPRHPRLQKTPICDPRAVSNPADDLPPWLHGRCGTWPEHRCSAPVWFSVYHSRRSSTRPSRKNTSGPSGAAAVGAPVFPPLQKN